MKRMLFMSLIVFLAVFSLRMFDARSSHDASTVVRVNMSDFQFEPQVINLKGGEHVTIEFTNNGTQFHSFMAGRNEESEKMDNSGGNHAQMDHGSHDMGDGAPSDGEHTGHASKSEVNEPKDHGSHDMGDHKMGKSNEDKGVQKPFQTDFFEGIEITHTEEDAYFSNMPGHGTMVTLRPGGKATIEFDVPADKKGNWDIGCFVEGHYEAGMKGTLVIE